MYLNVSDNKFRFMESNEDLEEVLKLIKKFHIKKIIFDVMAKFDNILLKYHFRIMLACELSAIVR